MSETYFKNQIKRRQELIKELNLFDANIWLGRPEGFPLSREFTINEMRRCFKKYWINGAFYSHWLSKRVSAQDGNEALREISDLLEWNEFLLWTALPLYPQDSAPLPVPENTAG
ncbi:MAG: hypothetical protein JSV03_00430, partial [Planctomycetota bacterium]